MKLNFCFQYIFIIWEIKNLRGVRPTFGPQCILLLNGSNSIKQLNFYVTKMIMLYPIRYMILKFTLSTCVEGSAQVNATFNL